MVEEKNDSISELRSVSTRTLADCGTSISSISSAFIFSNDDTNANFWHLYALRKCIPTSESLTEFCNFIGQREIYDNFVIDKAKTYPKIRKPNNCEDQVPIWLLSLDELLNNQVGLSLLLKYARENHVEENLLFYIDCNNYFNCGPTKRNEILQSIIKSYIEVNSPNEINISHGKRKLFIQSYLNGSPSIKIIQQLKSIAKDIYIMLEEQIYHDFCKHMINQT